MHKTRKNICHRVKKKFTYFLIELSFFFLTHWHVFIIVLIVNLLHVDTYFRIQDLIS